jgi:predicted O-methyltransferase YrrM
MDLWNEIDDYLVERLVPHDAALDNALSRAEAAGLPQIQVSVVQGKLLYLLARMMGARSILEIGTLAGYSTIWLGRALPDDGRLVTLELDPAHAEVARANLSDAGLDNRVEVRVGAALDTLPQLDGPFDLVFIDADKVSSPEYITWALRLGRPGTIVILDNVVRGGDLLTAGDPNAAGMREAVELVSAEPRFDGTTIQTVGSKGHDGFLIARVT